MFDKTHINDDAFVYYASLARLKTFVEQHYAEPLPLAKAARIVGLERTYFSRFFHEKTGVRYRDWLAWTRVGHALDVLVSRNVSITEAAFSVGFQDLRTFERACEKCTGSSPRQIRNQARSALRTDANAAAANPNK